MTAEEAIKLLESFNVRISLSVIQYEAVKMAKEALKWKIELEKIGFTKDVIKEYKTFEDNCVKRGWTLNSLLEAKEKQIPKKPYFEGDGLVRVKRGKWEEYRVPNIICCSECDWATGVDEKHFKYCPNCGAKMEGE